MTVLQIHLYRIEACLGPKETSRHLARPEYAYQMQPPEVVYKKGCPEKFCKIPVKTPIPESLFR